MKKLVGKTKYDIHPEGFAIIYACLKGTTKFVPAFVCHTSWIDEIKKAGNFDIPDLVLKKYNPEFHQ